MEHRALRGVRRSRCCSYCSFAALDRGRLRGARLALAGVAVGLTLIATPEIRAAFEERAQFAVSDLVGADPWTRAHAGGAAGSSGSRALIVTRLHGSRAIARDRRPAARCARASEPGRSGAGRSTSPTRFARSIPRASRGSTTTPAARSRGCTCSRTPRSSRHADFFNERHRAGAGPVASTVPGRPPLGPDLLLDRRRARGAPGRAPACGPVAQADLERRPLRA